MQRYLKTASATKSKILRARPSEVAEGHAEWFKREVGAKNAVELQPTFKSSTGVLKAKLVERGDYLDWRDCSREKN